MRRVPATDRRKDIFIMNEIGSEIMGPTGEPEFLLLLPLGSSLYQASVKTRRSESYRHVVLRGSDMNIFSL